MLTSVLTWKDRKHPSALLTAVIRANKRVEFLKPKVKVCDLGELQLLWRSILKDRSLLQFLWFIFVSQLLSFLLVFYFPDFPDFPDFCSFHFPRSSEGIPACLQP